MARWVFLADPTDYGWTELVRDGRAVWDGIGNAVAQKNLRAARPGDEVLIYHTAPDKAAVGTARVAGEARPDPAEPGRVVVDIEPVSALRRRVPLAELKADGVLSGMGFIRMPRVAVQPLTDEQWDALMRASGTDLATSVGVDPREAGGP
ncbi:MAG TPA: EVE domain-containing protein [Longimicrobiales bacterium]|nr:EVE domain-containing protein [Longimicrobiales bacterium]